MARIPRAKKDSPLDCHIESNQLIITIGISTLAYAYEHSELADSLKEQFCAYRVTNERVFAREVMRAMKAEDEVGNSILNKMFDKAIEDAIGDGCEGVEYNE
jgi:hypothetical protein